MGAGYGEEKGHQSSAPTGFRGPGAVANGTGGSPGDHIAHAGSTRTRRVPLVAWQRASWTKWHVPAVGEPQTVMRTLCGLVMERVEVRAVNLAVCQERPADTCAVCWSEYLHLMETS